jgi:hypothetical protein
MAITLQTGCDHCSASVEIVFDDWSPGTPVEAARWICPQCQGPHQIGVVGIVASVRVIDRGDPAAAGEDRT